MIKYLFYEDIKKYLKENENTEMQPGDGELEVSIKAFWTNPRINPKYRVGSNEPKKIRQRILNVQFFNVPADVCQGMIDYVGREPDKEYPSEDHKFYNVVYNCKDLAMSSQPSKAALKAIDYIRECGYNVPDIETLMKNIPEEGEFERIQQNVSEKWTDLIAELGNGQTSELLQRFMQMFSKTYEYVYGHRLSLNNAKMILAQKPDATLVLTERDWMKFFNCRVNPGAQRIYYEGPYSNRRAIEDKKNILQQNADSRGIKYNTDDVYSGHATLGLAIDSAETYQMAYMIGYDKSDVTPEDPDNDWRETKYGMSNNLTGEPNAKTAEFFSQLQPKEGKETEYTKLRELISDNAKLMYKVFVSSLNKANPEYAKKYAIMGNENNNPDYARLLPMVLKRMVDMMLEDEYQVKKPSDRAASRDRITGEVLFLCGVWDTTALQAVKGGKVDRETLVHDSNIVNRLLTIFDGGRKRLLGRLKQALADIPSETTSEVNESVSENIAFCTPEKMARDLSLQIIGDPTEMSDSEFEYKNQMNKEKMMEFIDRMNKSFKPA